MLRKLGFGVFAAAFLLLLMNSGIYAQKGYKGIKFKRGSEFGRFLDSLSVGASSTYALRSREESGNLGVVSFR